MKTVKLTKSGFLEANYIDSINGLHESDVMLDAYLDPEGFALKKKKIISSASKRDAETDYDTQGYGGGRSSDMDDLPGSGV